MSEQDLNKLLTEWLREHNAAIVVTALAPKGGQIEISNFLPDGWRANIAVVPVENSKK